MARPASPFAAVMQLGPSGINGFAIKEELSSGTYYRNHLAIRIVDSAAFSLKIVKGFDGLPASVKGAALDEIARWRAVAHPCLLPTADVFQHLDALLLAAPLAPLGAAPFLPPAAPLPPEAVAAVGFQLAGALSAAHGAGLVHRNVRPASLALFTAGGEPYPDGPAAAAAAIAGGRVALGDPSGALAAALCPSEGVALAYAAPETLNDDAAAAPADVWALGATLLELATGHVAGEAQAARRAIKRGEWALEKALRGAFVEDGARAAAQLAAWEALPAPLRALIGACLAPAPRARPTAAAAAAHDAFVAPRAAAAAREEAGRRAERVHGAMVALRSRQPLAPEALVAMLEAAAAGPSGGVEDADVYAVCGL
jgi:serine/threonine protein kinase